MDLSCFSAVDYEDMGPKKNAKVKPHYISRDLLYSVSHSIEEQAKEIRKCHLIPLSMLYTASKPALQGKIRNFIIYYYLLLSTYSLALFSNGFTASTMLI